MSSPISPPMPIIRSAADGWLNALPVDRHSRRRDCRALLRAASRRCSTSPASRPPFVPGRRTLLAVLRDPATATTTRTACLFTPHPLGHRLAHRRAGPVRRQDRATWALRPVPPRLRRVRADSDARHFRRGADPGDDQRPDRRRSCAICRPRCAPATTPRDWPTSLKPINDEMRGLQRDALVAYILHQMRVEPGNARTSTRRTSCSSTS